MARFADPTLYLSNSESTRDRIERWLDITVSGTVHAGVDTSQFSPDAEPAFEEEAPSILFVGRLDEGKGLRDLVDAVAELEGIATHLVGSGTLRRELEERVTDHGISERVVFHGAVPHQKVHQYYAAADVFCLPSYHEGFPVVNMEAMAAGCAVVSTTIDSIREQIDHGVHGLLVTPGDITALRDALSCVVNNDDFRERLQSNALARSREFTWDSQAEALEEYYRTAARQ